MYPPPLWSDDVEMVIYRLACGGLSLLGLLLSFLGGLPSLLGTSRRESRPAIAVAVALSVMLATERGLMALGYPLTASGMLSLLAVGTVFTLGVSFFTLRNLRPLRGVTLEVEAALEKEKEASQMLETVRAETQQALSSLHTALEAQNHVLAGLGRLATAKGASQAHDVHAEVITRTPLIWLAWDEHGRLILVQGRDMQHFLEAGRVRLGQRVSEAYAGSPVVQYVQETLEGRSVSCLFSDSVGMTWAAYYWPRAAGGAVVALPITDEDLCARSA